MRLRLQSKCVILLFSLFILLLLDSVLLLLLAENILALLLILRPLSHRPSVSFSW